MKSVEKFDFTDGDLRGFESSRGRRTAADEGASFGSKRKVRTASTDTYPAAFSEPSASFFGVSQGSDGA